MKEPRWRGAREAWIGMKSWRQQMLWSILVLPYVWVLAVHTEIGRLETGASSIRTCGGGPGPVVKKLSSIAVSDYNRSGLSHMTISGAVHHGMREVEVWMQTFAPGSGTPIHRHACEEVFLVLGGSGVLRLASGQPDETEGPGAVVEHAFTTNDTFTVPYDAVHQVRNVVESVEDLQLLVIISRPPIRVYVYESWTTPHEDAELAFPYAWDARCPQAIEAEDTRSDGSSLEGEAGGVKEESEGIPAQAAAVVCSVDRIKEGRAGSTTCGATSTPPVTLFHSAVVGQQVVADLFLETLHLEAIGRLKYEGRQISRGGVAILNPREGLRMQENEDSGVHRKVIDELLRPREWKALPNGRFCLETADILDLCNAAELVFSKEPSLLRVSAPVKIFGDLHGQFIDLLRFFEAYGAPSVAGDIMYVDYLFLGDYVDRGDHSLETITLLMALKIAHPGRVHLLRGNHETLSINRNYGLLTECVSRLGYEDGMQVFGRLNDVFEWLPLAALIDEKILCIHGGLGAHVVTINDIEDIKRPIANTSNPNAVQDILWSDPTKDDTVLGIRRSLRASGVYTFGPDRVVEFCERNGVELIVRAHEVAMDGFQRFAAGRLITLFSAPKYTGKVKNAGAILVIGKDHIVVPKLLRPLFHGGKLK